MKYLKKGIIINKEFIEKHQEIISNSKVIAFNQLNKNKKLPKNQESFFYQHY